MFRPVAWSKCLPSGRKRRDAAKPAVAAFRNVLRVGNNIVLPYKVYFRKPLVTPIPLKGHGRRIALRRTKWPDCPQSAAKAGYRPPKTPWSRNPHRRSSPDDAKLNDVVRTRGKRCVPCQHDIQRKPDPMSAPKAGVSLRPVAQPVAAPLTRAAIFLVVTIKPGSDNRSCRAVLLRGYRGAVARRGISRPGSWSLLRRQLRVRSVGPAFWAAAAGGTACVPRNSRRHAPRSFNAGRFAVPHPREAHGSMLRSRDADHGAHRRCCFYGG